MAGFVRVYHHLEKTTEPSAKVLFSLIQFYLDVLFEHCDLSNNKVSIELFEWILVVATEPCKLGGQYSSTVQIVMQFV